MIRLISSMLFVMITHSACAADNDQNSEAPFSAYLTALAATSHGKTTAEDVERVLGFYAEDVVMSTLPLASGWRGSMRSGKG